MVNKNPTWTNVKSILATKETPELLMLIKDLYALNKNNKTFIEARYLVGDDVIEPYKKRINDALYPDVMKNKPVSRSEGRKAISDYKKATKDTNGAIELMVLYVKTGTQFTLGYGDVYDEFYDSLISMFQAILKLLVKADNATQETFVTELSDIAYSVRGIGWGYYDDLSSLLNDYFPDYSCN